MPRWLWILSGCAIVAVILYGVVLLGSAFTATPAPDSIVCTADAKMCPDGSYVGRTGPHCEFTACPGADTSASSTPASVVVKAQINKSATALGIGVLPLSILEDSRCPSDVECVWAGTVRIKVRIHSALGDTDMSMTLGKPITTEAETITLQEVLPAPHGGVTLTPAQYQFVFEIAKRGQ